MIVTRRTVSLDVSAACGTAELSTKASETRHQRDAIAASDTGTDSGEDALLVYVAVGLSVLAALLVGGAFALLRRKRSRRLALRKAAGSRVSAAEARGPDSADRGI